MAITGQKMDFGSFSDIQILSLRKKAEQGSWMALLSNSGSSQAWKGLDGKWYDQSALLI